MKSSLRFSSQCSFVHQTHQWLSILKKKINKLKLVLCLSLFPVNHHPNSKQWRDRNWAGSLISLKQRERRIFLSHKLTPRFLISPANEYIVYLLTLKLHQPHLNSELPMLNIWLWANQALSPLSVVLLIASTQGCWEDSLDHIGEVSVVNGTQLACSKN